MSSRKLSRFLTTSNDSSTARKDRAGHPGLGIKASVTASYEIPTSRQKGKVTDRKNKAPKERPRSVYARIPMPDVEMIGSLGSVKEQLFVMVRSLGGIKGTDIKQLTVESTKNDFSKILKNARAGRPSLVGGFKSGQEPVTLISTSQLIELIQSAHIKPKLSEFLHPKPGIRTLEQSSNLLQGSLPSKKILL